MSENESKNSFVTVEVSVNDKNKMSMCNYQTVTLEESLLWYIEIMLAVDRIVAISPESTLVLCNELQRQMQDPHDEFYFTYSEDAVKRMANELRCSFHIMNVIIESMIKQKLLVATNDENIYIAAEWLPVLKSDFWDGLPKINIKLNK